MKTLLSFLFLIGALLPEEKIANRVLNNEVSSKIVPSESDPWDHVGTTYRGICNGEQLTLVIETKNIVFTGNGLVTTKKDIPDGQIKFHGHVFQYICLKTSSRYKYEIRIKRPNNPAFLGEYLTWRAYLEIDEPESLRYMYDKLKLTVVKGLSSVEKVKYRLPDNGISIMLEFGPNDRTPY